jgi:hypothetical protein
LGIFLGFSCSSLAALLAQKCGILGLKPVYSGRVILGVKFLILEMARRFKSNFSHGQLEEGGNWSGRKKEYGNSENN